MGILYQLLDMAAAAMKGSRKRAGSPQADPERYKKKVKLIAMCT